MSATLKLVLVFLLVAAVEASGSYDNFAGGELLVECPPGHGMDYFLSRFSPVLSLPGNPGDRVWDWECTKIDTWHKVFCKWFDSVNTLTDPIYFQCPADAFIAGVRSVYTPSDRVWSFKCCRILTVCMRHCELTPELGELNGEVDLNSNGVLNGFYGVYHPDEEDRLYRAGECEYKPCNPFKKNYFSKKYWW